MGNQVNVGLKFTADTGQAKASIQELQSLLNKLALDGASTNSNLLEAKKIQAAAEAAKELSYHLNNAYNAKTGRFDLSSLDKSLKTSGTNITELSTKFLDAGDTGQQAFLKLAQSISQADQPMLKVSNKLQDFAKTLKQTAKYQISNNILRGFQGAIQSAYGYAKDLNASLTDIRIVTGQNAEQMAKFAEQANKAAKALSTTTTDYTKGSLIYFQQGLGDEEVRERTETTIKMANVTGESTSKIADQMTAVWNNFADGSKELSYYADAMVALGAATASSSDEISEGINKFAATAKTVGLSYEYATAALATVTARTRESADVVGNAFKTLFARIQGLNQGDTLDDGTTLNKYSAALDKVGVSIKDASGGLKQMDQILDDLGPKWQTMEQDQKMALAQTVAGVRQYSQFMALMDNYDYFKENVKVAEQSSGTLEQQAEIYAESWEAAQKRVRAAAEGVYQDLIDDKFFISLNNGIANAISGLDAFIDKAGGLKTIIASVGGIVTANFANKIPDAIQTARYNIDILTKGSEKAYQNILKQVGNVAEEQFQNYESFKKAQSEGKDTSDMKQGINKDSSLGVQIKQASELANIKNQYANVEDKLTNAEKQRYQTELSILEVQQQQQVALVQEAEAIQKNIDLRQKELLNRDVSENALKQYSEKDTLDQLGYLKGHNDQNQYDGLISSTEEFIQYLDSANNDLAKRYQQMNKIFLENFNASDVNKKNFQIFTGNAKKDLTDQFTKFYSTLSDAKGTQQAGQAIETVKKNISSLSTVIPKSIQQATGLDKAFRNITTSLASTDIDEFASQLNDLEQALGKAKISGKDFDSILESLHGKSFVELKQMFLDLGVSEEQATENAKALKQQVDSIKPQHVIAVSETFANLAGGAMSAYSTIASVRSIISSLNDDDLSAWEKFAAVLSGLSMMAMNGSAMIHQFVNAGKGVVSLATQLSTLNGPIGQLAASFASTGFAASAAKGGIAAFATGAVTAAMVIGGLAIAIAGLVAIFKSIHDASPEGKLERVSEAAEKAKQAADEATQKYEDLKATFDDYDTAIDKLDDLKVGTEEFTEALAEANEQAWNLIETYGLIKGEDWHIDEETGKIVIDKSGKDKATQEAKEEANTLNTLSNAADLQKSAAELNVVASNLEKKSSSFGNKTSDEIIEGLIKASDGKSLERIKSEYDNASEGDKNSLNKKYAETIYGENATPQDIALIKQIFQKDTFQKLQDYNDATKKYQQDIDNSFGQQLLSTLNNNEAYQNSKYKNLIYDSSLTNSQEKIDEVLAEYSNKSNKEIREEFDASLPENYKRVRNQVIDTANDNKVVYSNLNINDVKEMLAYKKALGDIGDNASETAMKITEATKSFSDSDKKGLDTLLGNLSSEDIQKYKESKLTGDDFKNSILSEDAREKLKNAGVGKDVIEGWFESLQKQIESYKPPEFNLSNWQENLENQLTVAEKITDGGILKDKYYEELSPELQQYFEDMNNGTHQLTISAEEFNEKIRELSQQDLKDSIENSQYAINEGVQAYSSTVGRKVNQHQITDTANMMLENSSFYVNSYDDKNGAVQAMKDATGLTDEDLSQYDSVEEKIQAIAQAWLNLTDTLESKQTAFAASMSSIQDLDAALVSGTISAEAYDKAFNGVIAADASANGFNYSEIEDYAKTLMEVNDELADNEQLAKKIALAEKKQGKAVDDLVDNYKDYASILNKAKTDPKVKSTEEYSKAVQSLRKDMSLLTGIEKDAFSDKFINSAKTQKALQDVANGVDGAIEKFRALAEVDVLKGEGLKISVSKDYSTWDALEQDLIRLNQEDIEIGATVDNSAALDALAEMMQAAGMTVEEMQQHFNELGWDPEITYKKVDAETASQLRSMGYQQYATLNPDGSYNIQSVPLEGDQNLANGSTLYVPVIGSKNKGGGGYKKIDVPKSASTKQPKSSGGGGGGSKSSSHADHKNYLDKERYHTVKNQLEDLNAAYDDLSKAKDRAFGKSRIDYIDKEIDKTDELIKKQEEYLSEIENNLPTDKALMEQWYKDAIGGPAIEYDESGNISNFDEIQDAMFDKYNSMADSLTEDDDNWKIFEKKYEQFEKALKQYEETYDLLRDETQKKQDLINQQIDAKLEKVQYSIEVQLDVPDSAIKVLEYKIGKIDDDAFNAISAIGLLSQEMDEVNKKIKINRQGLEDVLKLTKGQIVVSDVLKGDMSSLYENGKLVVSLTSDQVDAIKEYRDNLIDLNSKLDDLRSNIEDKVMDAFSAWTDKLSKGTSSVEHYGNVLASYKNIIDTIGKDTLGITNNFLNNLAQATVTNAIDQLKSTKDAYDSVLKAKGEAEKALEEAKKNNDKESQKFWEDTLLEINEQVQSSNEEMMSSWENALSTITDQFENTLNNLIDSFNNSVYQMGGGLSGLADDFSRQQDIADTMLDDYQKIYELSKLSRDINKTIDDTDIISGKQKLKKLLGQINGLQEDGNKMSKYNLEYLQKTYDLRLAEIELEEAQRAKNTVRLQKDSEGNWSYIYTQSSDAIDSAQQKYEDALYAMQDLSSNYIDEMSQKLIDTSQEMAEAIANVRVEDFASQEDYYVAIKKIQDSYEDQLRMQENELNKAIKNNKDLYDEDWTNYHNATGYKISDTENFVTSFKDSLLGGLLDSQENSANFSEVIKASADALTNSLKDAATKYFEAIEKAMNAAGTSTKDFANDASESIKKVVDESQKAVTEMDKITNDMDSKFKSLIDSVTGWQKEYSIQLGLMEEANLSLIESFNKLLECLSIDPETGSIKYDVSKAIENKDANNDSNSSSNSSSSSSTAAKYDTGGYTGNWGDAGKLAVLHEKELVLNAEDTANVLTAVQLVRAMLNTIDLNAQQASVGFGQLVASTIRDSNNETLQQDVHIVAEFPNVEDHNEIKEAFNNLINQAAQYANRA